MTRRATKPLPALEEILQILRNRMPELVERHHVKTLGVFGSYVRGEQTRKSDVDILVEFTEGEKLLQVHRLGRRPRRVVGG